jgi:hypothetical protein
MDGQDKEQLSNKVVGIGPVRRGERWHGRARPVLARHDKDNKCQRNDNRFSYGDKPANEYTTVIVVVAKGHTVPISPTGRFPSTSAISTTSRVARMVPTR